MWLVGGKRKKVIVCGKLKEALGCVSSTDVRALSEYAATRNRVSYYKCYDFSIFYYYYHLSSFSFFNKWIYICHTIQCHLEGCTVVAIKLKRNVSEDVIEVNRLALFTMITVTIYLVHHTREYLATVAKLERHFFFPFFFFVYEIINSIIVRHVI